ncbi:hypothetical protein ZWY2020_034434 [Hordeum vulgare]|uniref:KIB1-4 beta-propeller domain-containing protein n=1 Tax=Hordeum vulgare subsp. vulgare TaxID=112509 RepID=A0A8I6XM42_HORVV|nr:hypothetical protein ZWY2020_034434 [Hordeum vulgare]
MWFRGVCRSWRLALPAMQPPWLVIPDGGYPTWMDHFTFLSLPTRSCARWALPDSRCVGSSAGWLALLDPNLSVTLLNPLTHAQVRLPPLRRDELLYPSPFGINSDGSAGYFYAGTPSKTHTSSLQHSLIQKVAFYANPTVQDHAVAVLCRNGLGLAFTRAGLNDWQWLHWPDADGRDVPFGGELYGASNTDLDIVYHDGKFYYMTLCGQIWTLDAAAPSPVTPTPFVKCRPQLGPDHRRYGKHLVFTQDGMLHVVWSDGPGLPSLLHKESTLTRPMRMHVQSYHPGSSRARRWRKARHLNGRAFLIGSRSNSLAVPASVASAPSTWIRPNCVYFTCIMPGSDCINGESVEVLPPEIWEFDVKTGVFQECDRRDIPDSDWLEWPKAIWFTPSLL